MDDVQTFTLKPETVRTLEELDQLGPCACTESTSCDDQAPEEVSK